ncbi:MAG TPA: efflux RND transporter periplasmic adaptor subunit [Candidatus Sulfopaludibacter sp.]|nr:efflux RND transporter periplasmic adaptor subunit [Candidatus Sulfopaludibacter sp.]
MKRNTAAALLAAASTALLAGCGGKSAASTTQGTPPPVQVRVSTVTRQDVPIYGDWVATLDGYVNANIQPHVSGYLIKQNYREGSFVHKDEILFEIDPRPFQAALNQAEGQLAQAKGQLSEAEGQVGQSQAQLKLAEMNVRRDTPLAQAHAIPQSQLDTEVQAQAQNEALVRTNTAGIQSAKAAIQAAEANVDQAQLNLGFTHVRSLIDGIAGIASVQIGNLVGTTTVLTTVSSVNPIKAYFSISEQEYLELAGKMHSSGSDLLREGSGIPLQLTLSNNQVYPHPGHMIFADRQVDPQTGTIRVVGAFANPGNVLRPGQFGRIKAMTALRKGALLVPQRAINELQGRNLVSIVEPNNRVRIQSVQTGDKVGEMWIVESGLQVGERVITAGSMKVTDGTLVDPVPEKSGNQ